MSFFNGNSAGRGRRRHLPLGVAALALALPLAACDLDSVLEVDDPDVVTPIVVRDTANLRLVRNGAIFEFARGYGGLSNDEGGQILLSGLLADEFWTSDTYPTRREIDERQIDERNSSSSVAFFRSQRARAALEQAAELYASSSQANTPDHALMLALAGYSYVFFGENYCSGVPFSTQTLEGQTIYGQPLPTDSIFERAIDRFDAAIAAAGSNSNMLNLARIGRARALLNLGRFAEAAAAAAAVPLSYEYDVEFSSGTQATQNAVALFVNGEARWSVASDEGGNGMHFFNRGPTSNTIDERVPVDSTGFGVGGQPHYDQFKYEDSDADIPLATGVEAYLIRAEAELRDNDAETALTLINQTRTQQGLTGLTADQLGTTAAGRVQTLFRERAFSLWLTSHRLGDLRRLIRQYGYTEDQAFPSGETIEGVPYGNDVNIPVPFAERNNPNFTGCLDRNA